MIAQNTVSIGKVISSLANAQKKITGTKKDRPELQRMLNELNMKKCINLQG